MSGDENREYWAKNKEMLKQVAAHNVRMKEVLLDKVIGQNHAVEAFVNRITASMTDPLRKKRKKPRGIFLFAGPPGVGKTFLAEKGAEYLELPCKRFDMSEYAGGDYSINGLIGFERTYRASVPGVLTGFVHENHQCVLIFDEIEKAHSTVIQLFLQILDASRLTDKYTEEVVSFDEAFIIFTTNAGRSLYENRRRSASEDGKRDIIRALKDDINPRTNMPYFPEAILSRFSTGSVIMFCNLSQANLIRIMKNSMEDYVRGIWEQYGIEIKGYENLAPLLLLKHGGEGDARELHSEAIQYIGERFNNIPNEELSVDFSDVREITFRIPDRKRLIRVLRGDSSERHSMLLPADKDRNVLNEKQSRISQAPGSVLVLVREFTKQGRRLEFRTETRAAGDHHIVIELKEFERKQFVSAKVPKTDGRRKACRLDILKIF